MRRSFFPFNALGMPSFNNSVPNPCRVIQIIHTSPIFFLQCCIGFAMKTHWIVKFWINYRMIRFHDNQIKKRMIYLSTYSVVWMLVHFTWKVFGYKKWTNIVRLPWHLKVRITKLMKWKILDTKWNQIKPALLKLFWLKESWSMYPCLILQVFKL